MNLREAAEMALEALETYWMGENAGKDGFNAIQALRQALAMEKFSEVNQEIEEAIKKGTKAWADVPNATEWVGDLRGTDFSGALKPPLTCLETPGIVDLDKYYSVTYKSPLGASVYDVDGVKWLIENRGADYFTRDVKKVDMSEEHVEKSDKSIQEREWVGLTDQEIWDLGADHAIDLAWAREIEAKLKEKNV